MRSVIQERVESPKPHDKPKNPEALLIYNGNLIENLLSNEGWTIIEDLIDEGVASVLGRKTNGYYYYGDMTRSQKSKDYLTGYYEALTQLNNRIRDFIIERDKLVEKKKEEQKAKNQPYINPFLEELNDNDKEY